jgi:Aminoglycoside-2''-adenylyltransferase
MADAAATPVPPPVAYVRDLLLGFDSPWFLCGGWAADAWHGRLTRDHADVDIAVFHRDQRAIFEHFPGWALVAHDPNVPDDTSEPWNGRDLDLPAHIHVPTLGSPLSTLTTAKHTTVEFEFLLNELTGEEWVLNREPRIALPLDRCIRQSDWALPTAAPEVVLFYKGGGNLGGAESDTFRPRDEQDFHALLPTLTDAQRSWLRDSLATVRPGHPWLTHFAS